MGSVARASMGAPFGTASLKRPLPENAKAFSALPQGEGSRGARDLVFQIAPAAGRSDDAYH